MLKKSLKIAALGVVALSFTGCAKIVENTIKNNPEIVFEAIKKDPVKFIDTLNEAGKEYQTKKREEEVKKSQEEMEQQFANPVEPEIDEKRATLGPDDAPVTIVEYADFQCGYCSRAHSTVKQLMSKSKYDGKIRLLYKHLPVTGAPMSVPAAEAFEAIAMMDEEKAYEFYDKVFENQGQLRQGGEEELEKIVKEVVGDKKASKVLDNTKSEEIQGRLAADRKEAQKYQINGTPAFVINGVFLKGAYPLAKFEEVVDRHLEAKN